MDSFVTSLIAFYILTKKKSYCRIISTHNFFWGIYVLQNKRQQDQCSQGIIHKENFLNFTNNKYIFSGKFKLKCFAYQEQEKEKRILKVLISSQSDFSNQLYSGCNFYFCYNFYFNFFIFAILWIWIANHHKFQVQEINVISDK